MHFVCTVELCAPVGTGSPSVPGWGAGMLLDVYTSMRASWGSNSGHKQMTSWEKKFIPSNLVTGFAP